MTHTTLRPVLIGCAMAALMLLMMHDRIMSGSFNLFEVGIGFILAHVGIIAALAGLSLLIPKVRHWASTHWPNAKHILAMLLGMTVTAWGIHMAWHVWGLPWI